MSEPSPIYFSEIIPTKAELKLIARLRHIRGMAIVDSDSMTLWATHQPEHCNGKHAPTIEEAIIEVRNA